MAKKVVLIVDDNPAFRDLLKGILEVKGLDARVCDPPDYQCLKEQAPPYWYFEVLLDLSLDLTWLEELEADQELAQRLRIWVVTGVPDADIGELRSRFPQLVIQQQWFDKADLAFPDELVTAIRQETRERTVSPFFWWSPTTRPQEPDPAWLQDFPEPIRVLNAEGRIIWANATWSANPYTPPVDMDSLKKVPKKSDRWRDTVRWGPLPHIQSEKTEGRVEDGYYRLRECGFEGKDRQTNILQWLSPIKSSTSSKLHEEVERILREVTRTHFTRARFYTISKVPGGEGIISLEQQVGGLAGDYSLPIHRPLKGKILKRLQGYKHISRDQMRELEYRHIVEAEESPDEEWATWNQIIGIEGMVDWIEIPVLDKDGKRMRVLGLLVCDCKELNRPGLEPGKIPFEAVSWLKNYLGFAVASLRTLLRNERKRQRVAAHEIVMKAQHPLLHAIGLENLEHALLQQAVEIIGADGGWFLTAVEGTEQGLEVRAALGSQQKKVRPVISPSATRLAVIDAWKTQGMIVELQFRKSSRFKELCEGEVWKLLAQTPGDGPDFQDWIENEIGSLVAAPVKRGERVIGAVSLHHKDEMHFDSERLFRLDDLLQAVAPLMEAETQRQGHVLWLGEVVHRIGARVNAVAGHLEILDQLSPDQRDLSLGQATDQAGLLRRLLTQIRDKEHPWRIEGEFVLKWSERLARVRKTLTEQSTLSDRPLYDRLVHTDDGDALDSATKLKGDSDALDMVLSDLLGNAYKYSDGEGPIKIGIQVTESHWLLKIANPGRISKGEEDEIFKLDRRGSNAHGEGLGLGLAISRNTARLHSGNLVLENSGAESGHVVFKLEWPYVPQAKDLGEDI